MADNLTHLHQRVEGLSAVELGFLRGLLAGESQRAIASRLEMAEAETLAVRQSLLKKLEARCLADAVREGIYAGL